MSRRATLFIAIGIGVVGVATFLLVRSHSAPTSQGTSTVNRPLVNQAALAALPHKSASSADISHLASSLVPPTNMWLSGMVLQKTPEAVFPMPLSFLAKDNGFEIGLPTVTSKSTEIDGPHTPGITVQLPASGFQLTRYDKLSATLTYRDADGPIGNLTVSEGSPFVFYTASKAGTLNLADINPADIAAHDTHYARYSRAGHTYAVYTRQGSISVQAGGLVLHLASGNDVAFYGLSGSTDPLKYYAGNVLQSVSITHDQHGPDSETTFAYHTSDGKPTVFSAMPYTESSGQNITNYDSIWGKMPSYVGKSFTIKAPNVTPSDELDLTKLTAAQKQQLIAALPADIAATKFDQQDSYYAGKQLARAANLLTVAKQLGQQTEATQLQDMLKQAFAARLNGSYFYYDTKLKGVAATTTAFGSQDFNDHHFHYGYWLYAGSILAKYDSTFVHQYGNQLDLLAADIASYQASAQFPLYRTYDPYAGHSWAAGLAPFADGNNQESSSEAIHAWNGVALWGEATHNQDLAQTGEWMLANEAQTAQEAWRSVDTSEPSLKNYTSPVASLNFGGKRTYSTFFSDDPTAKLGIQLIPMDPSMSSFASDKGVATRVQASVQNDNFNVSLGDYALMYLALQDPRQAADLAQHQTNIDDGNSKTYLLAWIFSRENQ